MTNRYFLIYIILPYHVIGATSMPRLNPNARPDVNSFATIDECNTVLENAIGYADLKYINQILERRKTLRGLQYPKDNIDLVDDALTGLDLYEHLRTSQNGRQYRAQRTKNSLAQIGVTEFMKNRVRDRNKLPGFLYLYISGLKEFTCEYLILKHSHCFDDESVQLAREFVDALET